MIGLDSLYAMLARPVRARIKRKRIVEKTENSTEIAEDSHESPQSQLPPNLEHRQTNEDRQNSLNEHQQQTTTIDEKNTTTSEQATSPLPHIDINI
ncbi:hypothetical protein HQQ94_22145 [Shewanella sp. VB17]|uniref:hypothetical protein n=1 Tax=Shewanella sp. VB17 TaxID=2739432 RepID=UPI001C25BA34|nr:hypothetical protein [Shewanella sp. VB17]NRD75863.1 hypothetical protein [Shewanella sp. VB17]